MTFKITSTFANRTKVRFYDENEPMFDHKIVETYENVGQENLETVLASIMDVMPGVDAPKFGDGRDQTSIPEKVQSEISENYRIRYAKFNSIMGKVNGGFLSDGSQSEISEELSDGRSSYGGTNSQFLGETVKIEKTA